MHQLRDEVAVHKQSFGIEEGLLGRSESKLKLSQEHFLMVGGPELKQAESKTESIFGCKQPVASSGGGLRLKSGGEMFGLGGGGERPLGEILRTERGEQRLGSGSETALGERLGAERLGTERLANERLMGTERLATERLARVAFNEDRLGIKAKLSVEETGVLSR